MVVYIYIDVYRCINVFKSVRKTVHNLKVTIMRTNSQTHTITTGEELASSGFVKLFVNNMNYAARMNPNIEHYSKTLPDGFQQWTGDIRY